MSVACLKVVFPALAASDALPEHSRQARQKFSSVFFLVDYFMWLHGKLSLPFCPEVTNNIGNSRKADLNAFDGA